MLPVQNKKQLSHIMLLVLLGAGLLCIVIALLVKLTALNAAEKIPVEQLLQQYWQEQQAGASLSVTASSQRDSIAGATDHEPIDGTIAYEQVNEQSDTAEHAQGADDAERSPGAKENVVEASENVSNAAAIEGVTDSSAANPSASEPIAAAGAEAAGKIDINTATAAQLQQLKGIGPSKAQAIIDDREQKGKFKRIEDIKRVKGIGEKLFAGIQESIVASP